MVQSFHSFFFFIYSEGFNILVYGLGSKRYLLDEFRTRSLNGMDVLVVNGYFPGLTIKEIFTSLIEGILEYSGSGFSGPIEQLEFIEQQFSNSDIEAFMIIHNMDGPSLQFSREQEVLGRLAAIPNLHVIASVDHINTPLCKYSHSRTIVRYWFSRSLFALNVCFSVGPAQAEPIEICFFRLHHFCPIYRRDFV